MTFTRIKQIVSGTEGILLLGTILFLFEQVPFDGFVYASDPLPSTVAPFRYKIPPPPPPSDKELPSAAMTETPPLPEQKTVSTVNSPNVDPPVPVQPTPAAPPSADQEKPPLTGAGHQQKPEKEPGAAAPKTPAKAGSKTSADSRLKSDAVSPKASVISDTSKKILEIVPDLTSPSAEMITIVLTGLFPPETQVVEGKAPKIICDFPDVRMEKTIKRLLPINGKYVLQVRTGIHPPPDPKSRVVIDLAPNHDYEVEQLFYEKNNRYSMIIREKP